MKSFVARGCILFIVSTFMAITAWAEPVTTRWDGDAARVYDTGFMHMLMKSPDGGVRLFNMDLVQNDAPGAGVSEKGVTNDAIWGANRARKVFTLDDPRAEKAYLVIYVAQKSAHPLRFRVNGNAGELKDWDNTKNQEYYRWAEFPAAWLKKGKNTVDFFCPEAREESEGWKIQIARQDEFESGGGDPADVGKTSFKSTDGGESWKESPFGPLGDTRAEYTVRISLDRSVKTGWLASPVIDLWKGDSGDIIVPLRGIRKIKLSIRSEVPEGTRIEYFLRKGSNPQPFCDEWSEYQFIGDGQALDFETGGADLNRRYIQFRAVLSTANPLKSPVMKSVSVTAELEQKFTRYPNIRLVEADNPSIQYSSIDWEWEKWNRPEFAHIREMENLDEVISGSRTEFAAQMRLCNYMSRRWRNAAPTPEYPGWDALSILNRLNDAGAGGMCIQLNNTLAGMCMAYGWQARLVNIVGHEICEVWNDEYGKWIFFDGDAPSNYNYLRETAEPQSMLDLHRLYLDYYFPGRSIDWMSDLINWMKLIEGKKPPVDRGSFVHNRKEEVISGFINAAHMRMVPRNNWYEKPFPRPLNHGFTQWPWDGYINWYDSRTPPKRQYSWFTDRPRDMWPDLNRVHVDITQGFGNDRLFLRFETYTPNFSHFEVNVDDTGWKEVGERWTWLLQSGRNRLEARAVNKLGAKGKPSRFAINFADAPFPE